MLPRIVWRRSRRRQSKPAARHWPGHDLIKLKHDHVAVVVHAIDHMPSGRTVCNPHSRERHVACTAAWEHHRRCWPQQHTRCPTTTQPARLGTGTRARQRRPQPPTLSRTEMVCPGYPPQSAPPSSPPVVLRAMTDEFPSNTMLPRMHAPQFCNTTTRKITQFIGHRCTCTCNCNEQRQPVRSSSGDKA